MTAEMEQLLEWLSESVEKRQKNYNFTRDYANLAGFLSPEIIEQADISSDRLRITSNKIGKELAEVLADIESEDDPVEAFNERVDQTKTELEGKEVREYTIAFPLNISTYNRLEDIEDAGFLSNKMKMDGVEFKKISQEEWEKDYIPNYKEHADRSLTMSVLWNYVSELPADLDEQFSTYWKASYYSRGPGHAVNKIENSLLLLLGKINFHMYNSKTYEAKSDPYPPRYSNLTLPYIYFKYQDFFNGFRIGEISGAFLNAEDLSNCSYSTGKFDIPNFEREENLDSRIKSALKAYQAGMTSLNLQKSFFDFWRGIESLASFSVDDSSAEIANRCCTFLDSNTADLNAALMRRLCKQRNTYTHEFGKRSINLRDRDLVKLCLEEAIKEAITKRADWTVDDWEFYLNNATSSKHSLMTKRQTREREIELIRHILQESN